MARHRLRQFAGYLGSGLIALFPAAVTIWVISAVVRWLAEVFGPQSPIGRLLQPHDIGGAAHGLIMACVYGVAIVLITLLGYSTQRRARNWILDLVNLLFGRFPIVNRVYGALQQVANVMKSQTGGETQAMGRLGEVVIVHSSGLRLLALLTSRKVYRIDGVPHLQVFFSSSPMPATGFLSFVPVDELLLTNIDIEAYTKTVVSLGSLTAQSVSRDIRTWRLRVREEGADGESRDSTEAIDDRAEEPAPAEAPKPKRTRRTKKAEEPLAAPPVVEPTAEEPGAEGDAGTPE